MYIYIYIYIRIHVLYITYYVPAEREPRGLAESASLLRLYNVMVSMLYIFIYIYMIS